MAKFPENVYSLRYPNAVVQRAAAAAGAQAAELAAIAAALSNANRLYYQRQYQPAIDAYKSAGTLIYTYLDANTPIDVPGAYDSLSKDPALFMPLLNIGAQYLTILPTVATHTLKPTTPVDPTKLTGGTIDKIGIRVAAAVRAQVAAETVAAPQSAARLETARIAPAAAVFATPAAPAAATTAAAAISSRSVGVLVGKNVVSLGWNVGSIPAVDQIESQVYTARKSLAMLPDALLHPQQPSDVALALPHDYYYVIPLGIAQSLQALGDYANAEKYYLQAAAYQYINAAIEVPFVWLALANLYLAWGNSVFQNGDAAKAVPIYTNVIAIDDTAPTSQLYTSATFAPVAATAKTVIADLAAGTPLANTINPLLGAVISEVRSELKKIEGGLDFYGLPTNTVPIWTFDYLQNVAVNFANLAVNAEQSYISYQSHADDSTVTKVQLQQTVVQAKGDAQAAALQAAAAQAELNAYQDAAALAGLRASDAVSSVADYSAQSWAQNLMQAESSQVQGGDNGDPSDLANYLQQLQAGGTISDSSATVAAALSLDAATYARRYEIDQLNQTAAEMKSAATQAQAEAAAAKARVAAANAGTTAANLRVTGAQQVLDAFDDSTFTADVWHAMGQTMYWIYQRYFTMAMRAAKLMQSAYNFETDQSLQLIQDSYASGEVGGLLGADLLLADVQSFTYDLITSTAGKPQPLRHEISLATNYSYLFETQFRKTGAIDFETRVDDFDAAYAGTYAGRISSVEVAVDGIVPVLGISGTLTNNGISTYRVPSAAWPANGSPGVKYRIQSRETLVLSDYQARNDSLLFRDKPNMLRIFEGAGVASTWHLEIPRAVNDIDYGALTDVRLIFYYTARYDDTLKSRVLSHLASLPGVTERSRSLPLAWLYPDAFFHFQDTGTLNVTLANSDFPFNQKQPVLTDVALLLTRPGASPAGITVSLATPGHPAAVSAVTDANGQVASGGASAFTPLATGSALGAYAIAVPQGANPALVKNGVLDLSSIANVSLVFSYTFTPRS